MNYRCFIKPFFIACLIFCCLQVCAQVEDMVKIEQLTMGQFQDLVARNKPKITGGCVSLTSGALGVSLIVMATEISKTREKNKIKAMVLDSLLGVLRKQKDSLNDFANQDRVIFQEFLRIGKIKVSTEEEKKEKDSLYHLALLTAAKSPVDASILLAHITGTVKMAVTYSSSNVISDFGAGATLLAASLDAVKLIAEADIVALAPGEQKIYEEKEQDASRMGKRNSSYVLAIVNAILHKHNG